MAQIMIVEDSQGTNKAICEYMKSAGHTLIPAFDGAEALNIFRDTFGMMFLITVLAHVLIFVIAPSENILITSATITNSDVYAFSEVDMPRLITQTILKSFPLSILCCTVISLFFSFLFSKGITTPILSISNSVHKMSRLEQTISNILSNAVNYTETGKSIKVSLDKSRLIIQNDCVPLSSNELQHIFEPFYRPDRVYTSANGGNGLGLYIVKTILDKLELQYHFKPMHFGNGMEFVIFF